MSLAEPQFVRIKRKRTEDPVDSLFIERGKKRLSEYVYRRQRAHNEQYNVERDPTQNALRASEPRRYHLTSSNGSAHVRGKTRQLAMLVERPAVGQTTEFQQHEDRDQPKTSESMDIDRDVSPRKKPRARRYPGTSQAIQADEAPTEDDIKLMDTLQAYAAELEPSHARSKTYTEPQMARHDASAMQLTEDEYVYDTFIRDTVPMHIDKSITNTAQDRSLDAEHGAVGFIVLEEGDEELWQALMDEEDTVDEADWNSEEDDENAENYYGADYPEDEMSSDDEFGRDAHARYRHGSDDEEWGHSDEENWDEDAGDGDGDGRAHGWR